VEVKKMRHIDRYVFLVVPVLLLIPALASPQAPAKLEKALLLEEIHGQLEEAIALYKEVLEESKGSSLGATAQLHIGKCYERLGRREAVKAYEAVIQDYPGAWEAVLEARKRLDNIRAEAGGEIRTEAIPSDRGIVFREVWDSATRVDLGSASPDGRFVSLVNWWEQGQLAVRNNQSGEIKNVSPGDGWRHWAEYSIWAPDSKRLAYVRMGAGGVELLVIGLDGSGLRRLFINEDLSDYPRPLAWAPNGQHILAELRIEEGRKLSLISVGDGSVEDIKILGWRRPTRAGFSPDSRYIAYDLDTDDTSQRKNIYLLHLDSGSETVLIDHDATDFGPFWTAGGNGVVFCSDRSGTVGVWYQEVADGKAAGEPVLVKDGLNRFIPIGMSKDGALFLRYLGFTPRQWGTGDIHMAQIDPQSGEVLSPARIAITSHVGWNYAPDFSPDGRFLSYVSNRGLVPVQWGNEHLIVRDLKTGTEQEIIPRLRTLQIRNSSAPQWAPDGKSFLLNGLDVRGIDSSGVYLMGTASEKLSTLLRESLGSGGYRNAYWAPSGDEIFMFRRVSSEERGVSAHNLESGQTRQVLEGDAIYAPSPDGSQLAYIHRQNSNSISLKSIDGSESRELFRSEERIVNRAGLEWSADGRYIYFAVVLEGGRRAYKAEILRVSVAAGRSQRLGIVMKDMRDIALHPDGSRIAFAASSNGQSPSIWTLENFLDQN
jgi:Tol biopolymer transport system component